MGRDNFYGSGYGFVVKEEEILAWGKSNRSLFRSDPEVFEALSEDGDESEIDIDSIFAKFSEEFKVGYDSVVDLNEDRSFIIKISEMATINSKSDYDFEFSISDPTKYSEYDFDLINARVALKIDLGIKNGFFHYFYKS